VLVASQATRAANSDKPGPGLAAASSTNEKRKLSARGRDVRRFLRSSARCSSGENTQVETPRKECTREAPALQHLFPRIETEESKQIGRGCAIFSYVRQVEDTRFSSPTSCVDKSSPKRRRLLCPEIYRESDTRVRRTSPRAGLACQMPLLRVALGRRSEDQSNCERYLCWKRISWPLGRVGVASYIRVNLSQSKDCTSCCNRRLLHFSSLS
jgi:hypothetical protein